MKAARLKFYLFGEFRVLRGEALIGGEEWGRQKARSLLKLLLTRPGRVFSRDEILEALWPDSSPEAAERSLRVTVSLLRRTLEPDLERGSDSRYILSRRPGYSFDHDAGCEVDAWEFEKRQARAEAARQTERLDQAIEEYRGALDLCQSEYLAEDPYEEWTMKPREEWRECRLLIFSRLSECLAFRGRYTEAVEVCNRALTLDEFSEDLHRRLMLYHYCAGEQALALQAYRRFARTLNTELGAAPSPELLHFKERMEARDVPGVDELRRYPKPRHPLRLPYSLSRTHFVGRDHEYAVLAERLRETMDGAGGVIAVEGEAGVGKTRLAEEFLGYARSRGVRVLSGRCYERDLGPPLEPVTEALGPVVDVGEMASGASDRHGEEVTYLWTAKSYDVTRIYHTLTRELVRESRGGEYEALVLFVDDVQWADPATLDFLSYLAKRISGERILLVFSYRREQASVLSEWLEGLAERRVATPLSLGRLLLEDLTRILARMSSRRFGELSLLADFLYRESEGNPFYAVEYLRWLIESGAVHIDSRRRISGLEGEALEESALPSGVRALIRARFGALDEEARDILELAAGLREHARAEGYEVLEEVTDPGASGASLTRPGMDRVRDLVVSLGYGGVSVVLAQDRDRFSREPAYAYLLRRELEEHGCALRSLNDRGDESPEGELTDGILDQLAKFERAKTAERTRRGKLRKAQEGKVVAVKNLKYGFRLNAARDGYEVDEDTMGVVRRIFRMVSEEGMTIWGAAKALEREGVKPPAPDQNKSGMWSTTSIRGFIKDDAYRPHTFEQLKDVLSPGVLAGLDSPSSYGVLWWGRTRRTRWRVVEDGPEGKVYRWKTKTQWKPRDEWIAVPVPDSGVPPALVDTARGAIEGNKPPSNAGRRFWELSGGLMVCGGCGRRMAPVSVKRREKRYFYYRCTKRWGEGTKACPVGFIVPAQKIEADVWQFVSGLLRDPERLRADLDAMIEEERRTTRTDPEKEARTWLDKLAEVSEERRNYQRFAAKGSMSDEELDEALSGLEEERALAERELAAVKDREQRIISLEHDRDALLESYANLVPEALDALTPEERHRMYRMLRLEVKASRDRAPEVSGAFGEDIGVCEWKTQPGITSR